MPDEKKRSPWVAVNRILNAVHRRLVALEAKAQAQDLASLERRIEALEQTSGVRDVSKG